MNATPLFFLLSFSSLQEKPASETLKVPGSDISLELIRLPGGKIKAGMPARDLDLAPFAIGAREVTWKEITACSRRYGRNLDAVTGPSYIQDYLEFMSGPEATAPGRPVGGLGWHGALGYCEWLSRKTGAYFRPPTEPEWEYAARGGSERLQATEDQSWSAENSQRQIHPVGKKSANGFGITDLFGNASELVLEASSPPEFGPIFRGGSFETPLLHLAKSRQTILKKWLELDPQRPRSLWWMIGEQMAQGLRVVRIAVAEDAPERRRAAEKIEIKILQVKPGEESRIDGVLFYHTRVKGELTNRGDRTLDELELMVYALSAKGKELLQDDEGPSPWRPLWNKCWPVLASSVYGGDVARPFQPGETRRFEVQIPTSFDQAADFDEKNAGARVTNLRFGK